MIEAELPPPAPQEQPSLFVSDNEDDGHLTLTPPADNNADQDLLSDDELQSPAALLDNPPALPAQQASSAAKEPQSTADALVNDENEAPARPLRKATKKALEEMERETQRLARSVEYQHEARTTKTFSLTGFLSRFAEPKTAAEEPAEAGMSLGAEALSEPPGGARDGAGETDSTAAAVKTTPTLPRSLSSADNNGFVELSDSDSDDDVPIPSQSAKPDLAIPLEVFDRALEMTKSTGAVHQQQRNLTILRSLANLRSPPRSTAKKDLVDNKPNMTAGQLISNLHRNAREQAMMERQERINKLKEDGIYLPTEQENEREELEVEQLLERARKEADRIARSERDPGAGDGEQEDDDDDEGYDAEDVDPEEWDSELEEDMEDVDDPQPEEQLEKAIPRGKTIIDDDDEDEMDDNATAEALNEGLVIPNTQPEAKDESGPEDATSQQTQTNPFKMDDGSPGGLSQLFQDTQPLSTPSGSAVPVGTMEMLGRLSPGLLATKEPPPATPVVSTDISSPATTQRTPKTGTQLPSGYSQLMQDNWDSIEPSQDSGFGLSRMPVGSTQLSSAAERTAELAAPTDPDRTTKKRRLEKLEEFKPAKRAKDRPEMSKEIRGMFDDEADLSGSDIGENDEDEDGDRADMDAALNAAMIDDTTKFTKEDAEILEKLLADQNKQANDKMLKRLVRDLDSGGLRDLYLRRQRQRARNGDPSGAGFLSDDSDDEADERRRRRKQLEYARMRKALFDGDQRIAGMAANPKQEAFLKAIEDRDDESDMSWLDGDHDAGSQDTLGSAAASRGTSKEGSPALADADDEDIRGAGRGGRPAPPRVRPAREGKLEKRPSGLRKVQTRTDSGASNLSAFLGEDERKEDEFMVELDSTDDEETGAEEPAWATASVGSGTLSRANSVSSTGSGSSTPAVPGPPGRRGGGSGGPMLFRQLISKTISKTAAEMTTEVMADRRSVPAEGGSSSGPSRRAHRGGSAAQAGQVAAPAEFTKPAAAARKGLGGLMHDDGFD